MDRDSPIDPPIQFLIAADFGLPSSNIRFSTLYAISDSRMAQGEGFVHQHPQMEGWRLQRLQEFH